MLKEKCLQVAQQTLERANKLGAAHAEAYVSASKQLSIDVRNQEVDTMKMSDEMGVGLRVFKDDRVGFSFSTDFSPGAVEELVRLALASSDKTEPDEHNRLPLPVDAYGEVDVFDPELEGVPVEQKIELARQVEREGRKCDARVKITETCSYQDGEYGVAVVNTEGVSAAYSGTVAGAYSQFVATEDGDNQSGFGLQFGIRFADLDPAFVGAEGARRAVRMLGAKGMGTRRAAVVLDPYTASQFLDILGPAVTSDAVQKGRSLLGGKVGQKVVSEALTIIDDGRMPRGISSAPFDAEGAITGETVLIRDGLLQGYLYNTYTAAREGRATTGNGTRPNSFRGVPEVGTTNFYIKPGDTPEDELIAGVSEGLYVTELMGMHTANPVSGDFSVGASGIWIKDGEFTTPVRGVAIAGNILELLSAVDCVGSDLRFFVSKGSPTVRISSVTISGS